MLVGYARVSTKDQSVETQIAQLRALGCDEIYTDQISGKDMKRPGLQSCLTRLSENDTLVVQALDRLSRSLSDLLNISAELESKSVNLKSIREGIDTSSPLGKMYFSVSGAFAQFERDLISQRTKTGLAAARAQGRVGGRPKVLDEDQKTAIEQMIVGTSLPFSKIAKQHGVSVATLYKAFPGGRKALVKTRFKTLSDFTVSGERFQILEDVKTSAFFWRMTGLNETAHRSPVGPFSNSDLALENCKSLLAGGNAA